MFYILFQYLSDHAGLRTTMSGSKASCKNVSGYRIWLLVSLSLQGNGYGMATTDQQSFAWS